MDKATFAKEINAIFKDIDPLFFTKIEKYKTFLQEYNKKTNLTRLDSEEKIYKDYFYESIIPYKNINFFNNCKVLDIGSGSGIPGVVLKLLYPSITLSIIESNNKKVSFLKELAKELGITVFIFEKRAEDIKQIEREYYDIVTSRAVAALKTIVEVSIPYAKVGGLIIEPKSSNLSNEIIGLDEKLIKLKSKVIKIDNFTSINGITHNVVIIKKEDITPKNYPRKWNVIIKDE